MSRRGEGREVERALEIVDRSGLPDAIATRLRAVVRGSGLRGDALLDVTRELVTHFEDGLAAGRTATELARDFGDEDVAASLIAREKRRADPDPRDRSVARGGRGDSWLRRLGRNLRYAARRAVQAPGFTLTATLSLAIGIGANTAIFTLVHQVLLDRPPYDEPDRLVDIYIESPETSYMVAAYPEMIAIRDGVADAFSNVAAVGLGITQLESDGASELVTSEMVTGNFFETLGIGPAVGRLIESSDDRGSTADPVVVLSHRFWQERYGGDPGVVGQTLQLSGRAYTVVGVAPSAYRGSFQTLGADLYLPLLLRDQLQPDSRSPVDDWGNHSFFVKTRLAPGASIEEAGVLLANVAADLVARDRWTPDLSFRLVPTADVALFPPVDRFIRMASALLMVVVGFVLLIACANLASFLLARSLDRRREIAVRLALGASRGDLIGQLASETVLLALVGGGVGMVLGSFALSALVGADLPLPIPITVDVGLNPAVFAFGLAISMGAGVLFGVLPALDASRTDMASTIKDEAAGVGRSRTFSLRGLLVAGQVAVSVVLLVGAGLFLRSFQHVLSVDPGFRTESAATVFLSLPAGTYEDADARPVVRELLRALRNMPGVTDVGLASILPLDPLSNNTNTVNVDGVAPPPDRDGFDIDRASISPGYLDAMGIPLLEGRDLAATDGEDGEPVVIVNQAFVDRFWPGVGGVGRVVRIGDLEATIVGVAATTKVRNLSEAPRPMLYRSHDQSFGQAFHVVARGRGDPEALALELMETARATVPGVWGWKPQSMARHVGVMLLPARLAALVVGAFAAVALVLAAVGLYGIVSYSVSQRIREVGIRMSLGADVNQVVGMLMGTGLRPVALGGIVGMALALAGARLLSGLLFGVRPFDPLAFGAVLVLFTAVATVAAWAPARRASRVNPVLALRAD